MRLLIEDVDNDARCKPDHRLYRILAQAQLYRNMAMCGGSKSMSALAADASVGSFYLSRILRLGFLSPYIVTAILRDQHPLDLTAKRLASDQRVPVDWNKQQTVLGI
jgi:hypothetical protein